VSFSPETFGKYYLVDHIATGGMAEIFKAKTYGHGGFENLVVIKRILAHLGEDPEFVEMFIDEAKVTVALQHRNVVRIYDFGKIGENYFIAMECLDGKDVRRILRKLAQKRRYLPVEFAVYIASEACKGLDYAHTKTDLQGRPYGIVHRDMSPSNLMVAYSGEVKVADFGIAKASTNLSDTDAGVLKGKYEYMSPEQAAGLEIDHRSDIFSLGVVLWEMLTGRRLFKTGSETTTLEKVKAADVPAPSTVNGRVPRSLDAIVMKALAREREDRYQSARALYEDLVEFLFPSSTDQLAEDVARFMADLFADEIGEERERLEQGSEVAARLHQEAPPAESWEAAASVTLHPDGSTLRLLIGVAAGLVVLAAVVGGGTAWFLSQGRDPAEAVVINNAPLTATLDVMVVPPAQVFLGAVALTEGPVEATTIPDLAPGIHVVRLVAEGHEPIEERVVLEPGATVRVWKTLEAVSSAPTPPAPVPTSAEPAPSTAPAPVPAPTVDEDAIGGLSVALVGGGWAHVYVDGVKLDRTAPLSFVELPVGRHEIRVENAELGIQHAQTVEIVGGETVTVRARPL
jgi:serine/threonine protein kinase